MTTFRAVVRRDSESGLLVGYFLNHPGWEIRGSDLQEIREGLESGARNLLHENGDPETADFGIETVSVL